MKTQQVVKIVMTLCLLLAVATGRTLAQEPEPGDEVGVQAAVGTAFTYQGRLSDAGGPVSGTCDFTSRLYDADTGGTLLGSDSRTDVPVSDGYFTLALNRSDEFGTNPFTGQARWLEITVNCGGGDTLLSPRQPLTAAPYAHYALEAPWSGLTGVPSGLDDGDDDTLADLACSTGQITEWDGGAWVCGEDDVGGGPVHDHWGESWTGTGTGLTLSGGSTGLYGSGSTYGVHGYSTSTNGRGVYGVAGDDSSYTYGVYGQNISTTGAAVFGSASRTSGYTDAVRGENRSSTGRGVYGLASATTGVNYGVRGFSNSDSGYGVYGDGNTGVYGDGDVIGVFGDGSTGVYGDTDSDSGRGLHGRASATSGHTYGVYGESASTDGQGVYGYASATSGGTYGVRGYSNSDSGYGVFGGGYTGVYGGDLYGVFGNGPIGVRGHTNSTSGVAVSGSATAGSGSTYGVYGESTSPSGLGVYGHASATSGTTIGVYGQTDSSTHAAKGVYGYAAASNGYTYGVHGESASPLGRGVWGYAGSSSGDTVGVVGVSASTSGQGVRGAATATSGTNYGVYGITYSGGGYAGYFDGRVHVNGTLTKSAGSFKIDHPLDPANKYLYHSFVESPDMLNLYNGNVTLDTHGEAWVELPAWFEVLNRDFRYQLTPLGGPGPGLYIAERIHNNRFKISGGEPGLEVSWQVTGIRHDPYAEANRILVEEEKPANERGLYLHPEVYGQSETMGLAYQNAQSYEEELKDDLGHPQRPDARHSEELR